MRTMYVHKCGSFLSYKREMLNNVHSCIDKNETRNSQPLTKFRGHPSSQTTEVWIDKSASENLCREQPSRREDVGLSTPGD